MAFMDAVCDQILGYLSSGSRVIVFFEGAIPAMVIEKFETFQEHVVFEGSENAVLIVRRDKIIGFSVAD
jgi:hypothetical protein